MVDKKLKELHERAILAGKVKQTNSRRLYKLARELGFDSYEANLLRNTTEENIRGLVKSHTPHLCSNCLYHRSGQCEVRELESQSDGCADWKYADG